MTRPMCEPPNTMVYDPRLHHRRSVRLPGFDYASARTYYVTICTAARLDCLAVVSDSRVELTPAGQLVEACLLGLPRHHPRVELDAYVVMPDHLHALLRLRAGQPDDIVSLSEAVRGLKTFSARRVNQARGTTGAVWQRGYYEHIVRDEDELCRIRAYIADNPARWSRTDPDRPQPTRPNHP